MVFPALRFGDREDGGFHSVRRSTRLTEHKMGYARRYLIRTRVNDTRAPRNLRILQMVRRIQHALGHQDADEIFFRIRVRRSAKAAVPTESSTHGPGLLLINVDRYTEALAAVTAEDYLRIYPLPRQHALR